MLHKCYNWFIYHALHWRIMRMKDSCYNPCLTPRMYEKYRELRALEWTLENLYKDGLTNYGLSLVYKRLFEITKRYELG